MVGTRHWNTGPHHVVSHFKSYTAQGRALMEGGTRCWWPFLLSPVLELNRQVCVDVGEIGEAARGHISTLGATNVQCSLSTVGALSFTLTGASPIPLLPSLLMSSRPRVLWSPLVFYCILPFQLSDPLGPPCDMGSTKTELGLNTLRRRWGDSEALSTARSIFSLNIAADIKCWNSGNVSGGPQTGKGFAHMLPTAWEEHWCEPRGPEQLSAFSCTRWFP